MNITTDKQGDVTILTLVGHLDATTAELVTNRISSELAPEQTKMVIDLSGVDFMSSAGLRTILAAAQDTRNTGGDLRLAGAKKNVKRVLDFSGLTKIIKYYDTVAAAVEGFV